MSNEQSLRTGFAETEGFVLASPALICRWRITGSRLPLANRHIRALAKRQIADKALPRELVAWAKQHIEWTLEEGSAEHPDGVLMLIVDESLQAAMVSGPYKELPDRSASTLARRALDSLQEMENTGVAPEALFCVHDDALLCDLPLAAPESGATSFVVQLAGTLGIPTVREEGLAQRVLTGEAISDLFLVSDEHGVVLESRNINTIGNNIAGAWERLLEKTRGA